VPAEDPDTKAAKFSEMPEMLSFAARTGAIHNHVKLRS
jgi:hypothetical protein